MSGSKSIVAEPDGDGISTRDHWGEVYKGICCGEGIYAAFPDSDSALVVDLEQVVLGLSEGSLSQRFALDLNISEPSTQYICLSAELQAGSAAASKCVRT